MDSATISIEQQAVKRQNPLDQLPKPRAPEPLRAIGVDDLLVMQFPAKQTILDPWFRQKDLAMVHAWRGVGKTHFALGIAYAVASGGPYLKWQAPRPFRVLYVDGEMPGVAMQDRVKALVAAAKLEHEPPEGYLRFLLADTHELGIPDLATLEGQIRLEAVIGDAEVIILDNLSSLARAGIENEGESWLPIAEWALRMRREGRSVLFIHHSNKNGSQRGTSRREDVLDVVIKLARPADYDPQDGARFEVTFEKARGLFGPAVEPFEASMTATDAGVQQWTTRDLDGATYDRVVDMTNLDMKPGEIANELGVHKSTVSRHLKKARACGQVRDER